MKNNKDNDYINFGDYVRHVLGKQCQYISRYTNGTIGYPNLGIGLRFKNLNAADYNDIEIHKDDINEFELRYKQHMEDLLK